MVASQQSKMVKMTVHLPNTENVKELRLILNYEAQVRGMSLGQACVDMVMSSVDLESYPPEVLNRLNEIHKKAEQRAVEKSLRMAATYFDE